MLMLPFASLVPVLISVFFTTLFILTVLGLKSISRSLSNIESLLDQTKSKGQDNSRDILSNRL